MKVGLASFLVVAILAGASADAQTKKHSHKQAGS